MKTRSIRVATVLSLALGSALVVGTAGGAAVVAKATPTYQYGINTYATYNCQGATTYDHWATVEVAQFKALKANSIAIGFPFYTDSISSNNIFTRTVCNNTHFQSLPTTILGQVIDIAHHAGLKVFLRPLLDQANLTTPSNPNNWRGNISPTNVGTWFANYQRTMKPYLQLAQAHHVEHFAIETELGSLALAPNWSKLIAAAHKLYKGDLAYNYSWSIPVNKVGHAGTSRGIDAYPAAQGLTPSSTPAKILGAWNHLLKTAADYHLPVITKTTIDEVGIPAQNGAYAKPFGNFSLATNPFNQAIQANWFTAACGFMKTHHMQGIYFWGPWIANHNGSMLASPNPGEPSNIQPLAQQAIKQCF